MSAEKKKTTAWIVWASAAGVLAAVGARVLEGPLGLRLVAMAVLWAAAAGAFVRLRAATQTPELARQVDLVAVVVAAAAVSSLVS